MIRSVQLVLSTNVLFLGLSVVTSLLSAWALGPDGRGELAVITMWLYIFALLGTLGLPQAHRYWTAKKPGWNSFIFTNSLAFSSIASIFVIAAGWLLVPGILAGKETSLIWATQLFLFNVPVILLTELLRGQLEGAKLFGWLGSARITFITIQATGSLIFYLAGILTLTNALIIIIVAQIVCLGVMFTGVIKVLRPRLRFSRSVFVKEVNYGFRSYFGSITEFAVWRLDQILLTALAAASLIGLYAIAVAVAEITATLASSVSDALLPEVAGSKSRRNASMLLARSLRLTIYAQTAALIPLWILAPYILEYVFGAEFVAATTVLRLLLVASVFWSVGVIFVSGLNGFNKPQLSTFAKVGSAITTVVTLLVLMPVFGITGAAVSSILGYAMLSAIAASFFLKHCEVGFLEFIRPRADDFRFEFVLALLRPAKAFRSKLGLGSYRAD